MGFEKTPPADKLIFATAIGSAILLLGLIPFFHGYFNQMVAEQYQQKVVGVPNVLREEVSAREAQNLASAPVSVEQAARELQQRGRVASPAIAPQASSSLDAVEGWNRMPNAEARAAAATAEAGTPAPAPEAPAPVEGEGAPAAEAAAE